MGRVLAIDYGKKRTGLAVTDPLQLIANGLATVPTTGVFDYIMEYIKREQVERIIVGLPKQLDGSPSENMKRIVPFVNRLRNAVPTLSVDYFDERFTSVLAHQAMLAGNLKKKDRQNKALVDEISATIILQGWMESRTRNTL